ncbi:hypothetical protein [Pontibacter ramchanderi]|uniref:Uncharacterized protein n=1 Tax=Pontibacter ramchanderi TaxID=1179743 RepID=A0A2N3V0J4_9BACT|nr:hypothetical protein [Pontibacter ramchanderi]PKV75138.1 hypothetical protein BD749_0076 [Pontibacter ramchanderi]
MKKLLYVALALSATACSPDHNLEDALYRVAEAGATVVIDSLHHTANKELERYTGIDSLTSRIGAMDTINVEREVEREVKRRIIEELSR